MNNCQAITWQPTDHGDDYVACEGQATECIMAGLFRHERVLLCEAHQKYFIDKCKWVVFEAETMRAVEFAGKKRYTVTSKSGGWWKPWHEAAWQQIQGIHDHQG